jgi:hypothetical protein
VRPRQRSVIADPVRHEKGRWEYIQRPTGLKIDWK